MVRARILSWLLTAIPACSRWNPRACIWPIQACMVLVGAFLSVRNLQWRARLVAKPAAWCTPSKTSQITWGLFDQRQWDNWPSSRCKIISAWASFIFVAMCAFKFQCDHRHILLWAILLYMVNFRVDHPPQACTNKNSLHMEAPFGVVGVV